jgi:hypothetical protein
MQIPTNTYRPLGQLALRLLICRDEKLIDKCVG